MPAAATHDSRGGSHIQPFGAVQIPARRQATVPFALILLPTPVRYRTCQGRSCRPFPRRRSRRRRPYAPGPGSDSRRAGRTTVDSAPGPQGRAGHMPVVCTTVRISGRLESPGSGVPGRVPHKPLVGRPATGSRVRVPHTPPPTSCSTSYRSHICQSITFSQSEDSPYGGLRQNRHDRGGNGGF